MFNDRVCDYTTINRYDIKAESSWYAFMFHLLDVAFISAETIMHSNSVMSHNLIVYLTTL